MEKVMCSLSSMIIIAALLISHPHVKSAGLLEGPPHSKYISLFPADYMDLKNGNIDILVRPLSRSEYMDAINDPTILLGPVLQNGMFCFDINCNETIDSHPGIFSPTSYVSFRRAIALLVNKNYIIEQICEGFAKRLDVPIQINAPNWINMSVVYPNYPWEANIWAAIGNLTVAGFIEGRTPNPYYNPSIPWSSRYIRVHPRYAIVHDNPQVGVDVHGPFYEWELTFPAREDASYLNWTIMGKTENIVSGEKSHYYIKLPFEFDPVTNKIRIILPESIQLQNNSFVWIEYLTTHPRAGHDLDELIIVRHALDPLRYRVGEYLGDILRLAGIPVRFIDNPWDAYQAVFIQQNYHIYTGHWIFPRFPTHMYPMYHSKFWRISNIVAPPCPRPRNGPSVISPNYDVCLEDIQYTNNIPEAIAAAKKAQGIHVWQVVNIPLWCTKSYYAWKHWLYGVCNMMVYGPINDYTFLNCYKGMCAPEPANTIKVGIPGPPQSLNILYAQFPQDYMILDRIWPHALSFNPYDIATDQPWMVQDWVVSSWVDPNGTEKTKVTYWIRKDIFWVAPITGATSRQFNTSDIEFSYMWLLLFPDSWHSPLVADIDHIRIVDDFCFEIYYKSTSYWFQYSCVYPWLPKYEWRQFFCNLTTYEESNANYSACERLILFGDKVLEVANITVNGQLLIPCQDYHVEFNNTGNPSFNIIHFKTAVSGHLVINYWNITRDPHGFFLGDSWEATYYSIGPFFPVSMNTSGALLALNTYFWLANPPLGEIDWTWWWGPYDGSRPAPQHPEGPRTGCFLIDIYDVVYACVAYGSQGMWEPDPNWFPGADLAPSYTTPYPKCGGLIDIYDLVVVLINYGKSFGHPPLDP